MKLSDLRKRYYCSTCNKYLLGDSECPTCGEKADHKGYEINFTMSDARINNQQQRKNHRKALTQPWRQGEVSREYLDAFPEQKKQMIKDGTITKEQARKAKNVWADKADIL